MNIYFIVSLIILLIAILLLIYFASYYKLKNYQEKMDKAELIIDENLNKKLDIIIAINSEVKKVTGKKDYLKEYVSIRDYIMTNIEKDLKLEEAVKLINNLINDYNTLNKDENFKELLSNLKKIDEIILSAKNIYNQNAILSNQVIKTIPNNIIAKIANFKLHNIYNSEKTEEDGN